MLIHFCEWYNQLLTLFDYIRGKRSYLMPDAIRGIHHITAIAGNPQRNLDFYTGILGLRLIKLTVNFDDPGTYHFYFGDTAGRPGTILTFFPWQNVKRGRKGTGQVGAVAFRVPAGTLGFWADRLKQQQVTVSSTFQRFDDEVLPLMDPDGLPLEIIASGLPGSDVAWEYSPVSPEVAIQGFAQPTLLVADIEPTAQLLTEIFGLTQVQQSGSRCRFSSSNPEAVGSQVDVEVRPGEEMGGMGGGTVHHIAWRVADDPEQLVWREGLVARGYQVTPVMDRQYFHSIYFREPGGILFEIATDSPGFATDENPAELGSRLKLPPWLEQRRQDIDGLLPRLTLPHAE
jgi:glyoxalase family protein